MTKHCVARMDRRTVRFFTGRYRTKVSHHNPITTGRHDKARAYEDESVAKLVCVMLNVAALAGTNSKPWAVMPLPEARK